MKINVQTTIMIAAGFVAKVGSCYCCQRSCLPMNIGFLSEFLRTVTKRAQRGLYGGKKVLSGHNVSDSGNRYVILVLS